MRLENNKKVRFNLKKLLEKSLFEKNFLFTDKVPFTNPKLENRHCVTAVINILKSDDIRNMWLNQV